jgi:3-phosphoshikimate 1-carboxyvinyltransferase
MNALVTPHRFSGLVRVPASKSHTIRRLIIASLAEGISEIEQPLDSLDTCSCVSVCRTLGAEIVEHRENEFLSWTVLGTAGRPKNNPGGGNLSCNVGNSGTTLFLALAAAALENEPIEFDGDEQIRRRSAGPLLKALSGLGASVKSNLNGCAPITIRGPLKGGRVSLPCPTSQYLTALLLAAPSAPKGAVTEIDVPLLNERPYIEMTLKYLDSQGIPYSTDSAFSYFRIPGGSFRKPMSGRVPADFSSAAFPAAAAVISGGTITLLGLEPNDTQGDKAFFGFLEKMGCRVQWEQVPVKQVETEWRLTVSRQGALVDGKFDLNGTPDLLPALAAVACFANGDTALVNAASARIKETDRIAVMAEELGKLGVKTTQTPDALVIHGKGGLCSVTGKQSTIKTDGRFDHRVVMALACAALGSPSPVEIAGVESVSATYPGFPEMLGMDIM